MTSPLPSTALVGMARRKRSSSLSSLAKTLAFSKASGVVTYCK